MGSVAAQVASWQRRARNRPGPLGPTTAGSGDSPNGTPLQVEILLDGIWTDITSRVMTRDGSGKVAITRGQPNETSKTVPATCAFQLNNRDGLFSPRNPASPYYGKIGRNTQLRVSVPSGNSKSFRFWGEVSDWPQRWDTSGTDVWVDLQAGGLLRRLGQGSAPIKSALYTSLSSGFANSSTIVAYWPCEDVTGSTSIASGLSATAPMSITGSPTLASFSTFAGSAPLPTMTAGSGFSGLIPSYVPAIATVVRFLLVVPSAGLTQGQVLCSVRGSGAISRWDVYYDTSGTGTIGVNGYNSSNANVFNIPAFGTLLNGNLAEISLQMEQVGADVFVTCGTFILNNGPTGIPTTGYQSSGTAAGQTLGVLSAVAIAPNQGLTGTTFGHVRVEESTSDIFDNSSQNGLIQGYFGEFADDRVYRLCGLYGINFEQIGDVHSSVTMGTQGIVPLTQLLDDCATADTGILYELFDQLGLGYRTHVSLENQAASVALSYSASNLAGQLSPVDDDQYTRNDVTVTRQGGSSARQTLTVGALSVLPPPAGVGPYPNAVTVNVQADSTLANQAGWRLHLSTVDEARYPTVTVNLAHASFVANPTLRQQVLALRPGDRLTISNPPPWLPPDLISQIVIGWAESIDHFEHRLTFNCVPESPFHTGVLEDAVLGRLDTGGSQLAADALPTDTTLLVATTAGPLWTTTDTPFDVRISGEQITVTGVTGAVSPQMFTCTRSVNGVVKPLGVGADVRLNQPMILAL